MDPFELMRKLDSTLPLVREWIDELLEGHKDQAAPIIGLGFLRLQRVFPLRLLEKTKVVVLPGKLPFPPLSRMGLTDFAEMENAAMAGITYKDTFFINPTNRTESLHFHELVHVVQWGRLGVDKFLLAYGAGLIRFGYRNSPLEQMAYSLEEAFDRGDLPTDIVDLIDWKTDAIWTGVGTMINRE